MGNKNKPIQTMQEHHLSASKLGALIAKYCIATDSQHTDDHIFENKVDTDMRKKEIDKIDEKFKLQLKGKKIRYEKQTSVDNDIFSFRKVGPKGLAHIRHVKSKADDLYSWLLENVQNNRERSLAITKLEETVMWLNKAISRSEHHD